MAVTNAVPGFRPSTRGFRFANRFPPGPTVRFGPLDPRRIGFGDASAGLCGGMVCFVRERFEAGLPIPPDTEAPANRSPLFRALVRRQIRSLDWFWTPLRFWWMGAIGPRRAGGRSWDAEAPRIRANIDAGHLVRVGLVRHQGLHPWLMTWSHQVVAYAYEATEAILTLRVYDPNWPGRDDVTVNIHATGAVEQSTGEPLIGLFRIG